MKIINEILTYSFAEINIEDFWKKFNSQRKEDLRKLFKNKKVELMSFKSDNQIEVLRIVKENSDIFSETQKETFGFETYKFFISIINDLSSDVSLSKEKTNILNILQKKFEIYNRIFDRYDSKMIKASSNFKKIEIYILFSIVLQIIFLKGKNLNYLNTSLKLNDLILKSGYSLEKKFSNLVIAVVSLEKFIVDKYY